MFHKYRLIPYLCCMKRKITCSKCNENLEENRIGKNRYCLKCHNSYMRKNRKKHSELTDIQRFKANCRSYLNTYIKRGVIKKQPCSVCSNPIVEAHHEDYSKPLDIIWLCKVCHIKKHKTENK
jgi:hypothetical protein